MKGISIFTTISLVMLFGLMMYLLGRFRGREFFKSQIIDGKYMVISNVVTRVEYKMVPVRTTNTFTLFSIQVPK